MSNRETAGLVLCLVCSRTGRSQRRREERRGALDGRRLRRDGDGELRTKEDDSDEAKSKGRKRRRRRRRRRSVSRREMQGTASPLFPFLFSSSSSSSSPDFKEAKGTGWTFDCAIPGWLFFFFFFLPTLFAGFFVSSSPIRPEGLPASKNSRSHQIDRRAIWMDEMHKGIHIYLGLTRCLLIVCLSVYRP